MRKQGKTLVILSPGFPASEADSTCLPAQQLFVRNLKQSFPLLNIIVIAFQYPFFQGDYYWHDIRVIPFNGQNKGRIFRLRNWMRIRRCLHKLNKQYKLIGLLSFWMGDCALLGESFAKRNGLRHFCWILGQDARPHNKYFNWIKPKAVSLIALSDSIAKEFSRNYKVTPALIIPIGIDPKLFDPNPGERDIDIMGVGSLIPLKQFHLLISVVNSLRESFPNIRAVICGDGPEKESLNALIKELHLERNIELSGELSHASILTLMQKTKVFVHPSSYEGFCSVGIEALYAGAHVISFVKPMDKDLKNWHVAENQCEMQKTVQMLLSDPALDHSSVLPYSVMQSTRAVMGLFDHSLATTF